MPLRPEIEAQFKQVCSFAKKIAIELESKYPSIVAIALVGSWARAGPLAYRSEDLDFSIISKQQIGLNLNIDIPQMLKKGGIRKLTFFNHTLNYFRILAFKKKSPSVIVKTAQKITGFLRQHPKMKKVLMTILGTGRIFFHQFERYPQAIQTYIPMIDRHNVLSKLQHRQRAEFSKMLTEYDLLLYSPCGFHKLIEKYLLNQIKQEEVKCALLAWDVDWRKYLRRAIECYSRSDATKISELYNYISYSKQQ